VGGKWEFTLTPDNLEVGMAANHVGPFLLTNLLAPKLLESSTPDYTPRVVFVSSAAHASLPQLDITTLAHPDPAKYTFMLSYGHTKAASILTAIELSKRSNGKIKAYSLHPGGRLYDCGTHISIYNIYASRLHKCDAEGRDQSQVNGGW
jgi:NAD(P)-dependent dehydrogenase (short-subunit alcohol dehydrogenase family)